MQIIGDELQMKGDLTEPCRIQPIQAMLLDLQMPHKNGIQVL